MKKLVAILLVLALVLSFAACAPKADAPAADAPAADAPAADAPAADAPAADAPADAELPLVGMSHLGVGTNNYTTIYTETLYDLMETEFNGQVELYIVDSQGDAEKQLSDIDDLIEMECDVVILWPVSATAVVPGVKALYDAGIPIINTNSGVDVSAQEMLTAFSGPSDYNQGYQAGEAMVAALGGEGKVVELSGLAGYDTAIQRTKGFTDAIAGTNIEIIASEPADWSTEKAQTIMETFIAKYGKDINGIYCADDGISAGALNALDAAGMNDGTIAITSPTLFASGYDAIAEGKQYASVLQSPIEDAKLALTLAVEVALGGTVEYDNRIPTYIVDKNNYSEFDRPTW
ncbi:MAG: sugar ABC transporter substrate-binding protein [Christensenellaceae bacterium]|nr:sugar ABC transporter substrate-binding protein [Christensenellaceae bacterium]